MLVMNYSLYIIENNKNCMENNHLHMSNLFLQMTLRELYFPDKQIEISKD